MIYLKSDALKLESEQLETLRPRGVVLRLEL